MTAFAFDGRNIRWKTLDGIEHLSLSLFPRDRHHRLFEKWRHARKSRRHGEPRLDAHDTDVISQARCGTVRHNAVINGIWTKSSSPSLEQSIGYGAPSTRTALSSSFSCNVVATGKPRDA